MNVLNAEYELSNGMRIFLQKSSQTQCLVKLMDKVGGQRSPLYVHETSFLDRADLSATVGQIMQFAYGSAHHDSKIWSQVWKAISKFGPPVIAK